jgi:hypothetical protein
VTGRSFGEEGGERYRHVDPGQLALSLPGFTEISAPVAAEQARQIITEKSTVSEEVRKRRRSRKMTGRAPQAAPTGHLLACAVPIRDFHGGPGALICWRGWPGASRSRRTR